MSDEYSVSNFVYAVVSGGIASGVIAVLFTRRVARIEAEVRSKRTWKEASVSQLLGPLHMQFDRTKRAFDRWTSQNLYLEAAVVKRGNEIIRDLLLEQGHLIPPDLLNHASRLVEHYDVWLEKFETQRASEEPDLNTAFVFVGPDGYPFPRDAANAFVERFRTYWSELYEEV